MGENLKQESKILNISNILTRKDIKMLENMGYVLLSENTVKKAENSQNYKIRKIDNVVLLQLSN